MVVLPCQCKRFSCITWRFLILEETICRMDTQDPVPKVLTLLSMTSQCLCSPFAVKQPTEEAALKLSYHSSYSLHNPISTRLLFCFLVQINDISLHWHFVAVWSTDSCIAGAISHSEVYMPRINPYITYYLRSLSNKLSIYLLILESSLLKAFPFSHLFHKPFINPLWLKRIWSLATHQTARVKWICLTLGIIFKWQ